MFPSPNRRSLLVALSCGLCLVDASAASTMRPAFATFPASKAARQQQQPIAPCYNRFQQIGKTSEATPPSSSTELNMFMGSDGGILGVGTPELITIILVGYFVLGPSDLYKLTKEIGKFVQNAQSFATEASASLENSMESNLQIEEIRKAQRDLNDAFSFRRSINVDESSEAFSVNAKTERKGGTGVDSVAGTATVAEAAATAEASGKKKIIRRRVKKRDPELSTATASATPSMTNIPQDLDVASQFDSAEAAAVSKREQEEDARAMAELEKARAELLAERNQLESKRQEKEELDESQKLREERLARMRGEDPVGDAAAKRELASVDGSAYNLSEEDASSANSRFQAQLNGSWNDQIVAKTDELKPLAAIMDQLALLEQEKIAADNRLEEEYRKRADNEEEFYRKKRALLESAAQQVQQDKSYYVTPSGENDASGNKNTTTATIPK